MDFSFDFQIHWLSITFYSSVDPEVDCSISNYRILPELFFDGCKLKQLEHGSLGYTHLETWQGIRFLHGGNNDTVHLSISGEHIGSLNQINLRAFFAFIRKQKWNYKITRFDLAFDLHDVSTDDVENALLDNKVRTYAKRDTFRGYKTYFSNEQTIYLGSRTSERMLRVYDRGEVVRFELEVKGKAADVLGFRLFTDENLSSITSLIISSVGMLRDYVDFDAEWWSPIMDFERAALKVTNPQRASLSRSVQWIEKSVVATLAAVLKIEGREWFDGLLDNKKIVVDEKLREWGYAHLMKYTKNEALV
jgi:DNA relaxase NicK